MSSAVAAGAAQETAGFLQFLNEARFPQRARRGERDGVRGLVFKTFAKPILTLQFPFSSRSHDVEIWRNSL
jgi:hypothetical protein